MQPPALADNEAAMMEAMQAVSTIQITYAARDSDFDGFEIHQGDYLALKEGKLFGTDSQLDALLEKLIAIVQRRFDGEEIGDDPDEEI